MLNWCQQSPYRGAALSPGGAGGSQWSQEGTTSGPVCHSRPDAGGSASPLTSDPHQAAREGEGEVDTTPTSHQSISSQRAALGQWHLQPLGTQEMQILRPHPRQTESEARGQAWGVRDLCLTTPLQGRPTEAWGPRSRANLPCEGTNTNMLDH